MREYDHFRIKGEIVLADPESSKSKYGHHYPEYMDSSDPDFLREGIAYLGPRLGYSIIFQLTKPSPGIEMLGDYGRVGSGFIVVEEKVPWSDNWSEGAIHESRITWKT